jgi:hypothetical protein
METESEKHPTNLLSVITKVQPEQPSTIIS